jgi:hypothetical protein
LFDAVAKYTIKIRNYQDQFARYECVRKVGANKKRAKELVERRKKLLTWLRAADYKKFEWILDVLSIIYKPKSLYVFFCVCKLLSYEMYILFYFSVIAA